MNVYSSFMQNGPKLEAIKILFNEQTVFPEQQKKQLQPPQALQRNRAEKQSKTQRTVELSTNWNFCASVKGHTAAQHKCESKHKLRTSANKNGSTPAHQSKKYTKPQQHVKNSGNWVEGGGVWELCIICPVFLCI